MNTAIKLTNKQQFIVKSLLDSMGYKMFCEFTTPKYPIWVIDMVEKKYSGDNGEHPQDNKYKVFQFNELEQFIDFISTPQAVRVRLNKEYYAEVNKNGTVTIGCQKFNIEVIRAIIKEYNKLNSK